MKHDFKIPSSDGSYFHEVSAWSDTRYVYCFSPECQAKKFGRRCHACDSALAQMDAATQPAPIHQPEENAPYRSPFAASATFYDWNLPVTSERDHLTLEAALNDGHYEFGDFEDDADDGFLRAAPLSSGACLCLDESDPFEAPIYQSVDWFAREMVLR